MQLPRSPVHRKTRRDSRFQRTLQSREAGPASVTSYTPAKRDPDVREWLHTFVVGSATTLRRHPGDDLVGIHDVAGLAVHAVGSIEMNLQATRGISRLFHFIHTCGAEILAGVAVLLHATLVADGRVVDNQVRGLVFLMLSARVIHVGEFVEGELAVAFGGVDDVGLRSSVRW